MDKNIETFKNDILFNEIHRTERSDKLWDNIDVAEQFIRANKEKRYNREIWMNVLDKPDIYYVFKIIASQVLHHEKLLILLDELKEKSYQTTWAVSFDHTYYKDFFEQRISNSKSILKKLRPYIIEETKQMKPEFKQRDLESDIGRFFKGWYIAKSTIEE